MRWPGRPETVSPESTVPPQVTAPGSVLPRTWIRVGTRRCSGAYCGHRHSEMQSLGCGTAAAVVAALTLSAAALTMQQPIWNWNADFPSASLMAEKLHWPRHTVPSTSTGSVWDLQARTDRWQVDRQPSDRPWYQPPDQEMAHSVLVAVVSSSDGATTDTQRRSSNDTAGNAPEFAEIQEASDTVDAVLAEVPQLVGLTDTATAADSTTNHEARITEGDAVPEEAAQGQNVPVADSPTLADAPQTAALQQGTPLMVPSSFTSPHPVDTESSESPHPAKRQTTIARSQDVVQDWSQDVTSAALHQVTPDHTRNQSRDVTTGHVRRVTPDQVRSRSQDIATAGLQIFTRDHAQERYNDVISVRPRDVKPDLAKSATQRRFRHTISDKSFNDGAHLKNRFTQLLLDQHRSKTLSLESPDFNRDGVFVGTFHKKRNPWLQRYAPFYPENPVPTLLSLQKTEEPPAELRQLYIEDTVLVPPSQYPEQVLRTLHDAKLRSLPMPHELVFVDGTDAVIHHGGNEIHRELPAIEEYTYRGEHNEVEEFTGFDGPGNGGYDEHVSGETDWSAVQQPGVFLPNHRERGAQPEVFLPNHRERGAQPGDSVHVAPAHGTAPVADIYHTQNPPAFGTYLSATAFGSDSPNELHLRPQTPNVVPIGKPADFEVHKFTNRPRGRPTPKFADHTAPLENIVYDAVQSHRSTAGDIRNSVPLPPPPMHGDRPPLKLRDILLRDIITEFMSTRPLDKGPPFPGYSSPKLEDIVDIDSLRQLIGPEHHLVPSSPATTAAPASAGSFSPPKQEDIISLVESYRYEAARTADDVPESLRGDYGSPKPADILPHAGHQPPPVAPPTLASPAAPGAAVPSGYDRPKQSDVVRYRGDGGLTLRPLSRPDNAPPAAARGGYSAPKGGDIIHPGDSVRTPRLQATRSGDHPPVGQHSGGAFTNAGLEEVLDGFGSPKAGSIVQLEASLPAPGLTAPRQHARQDWGEEQSRPPRLAQVKSTDDALPTSISDRSAAEEYETGNPQRSPIPPTGFQVVFDASDALHQPSGFSEDTGSHGQDRPADDEVPPTAWTSLRQGSASSRRPPSTSSSPTGSEPHHTRPVSSEPRERHLDSGFPVGSEALLGDFRHQSALVSAQLDGFSEHRTRLPAAAKRKVPVSRDGPLFADASWRPSQPPLVGKAERRSEGRGEREAREGVTDPDRWVWPSAGTSRLGSGHVVFPPS